MADQPTTPSGSRWEPDPDRAPAAEAPSPTDPPGAASHDAPEVEPVAGSTAAPVDGPADDERRAQLRGRAVVAGAAAALVLGGGLAGFVIGHSTASNGTDGFQQAGFTGPQDGGPNGQVQRPPGFGRDGDADGDGDHGFGQPPQGSTDGGSSNSSSNGAGTTGNPT